MRRLEQPRGRHEAATATTTTTPTITATATATATTTATAHIIAHRVGVEPLLDLD